MTLENIWKNKSHVPNHQPDIFNTVMYLAYRILIGCHVPPMLKPLLPHPSMRVPIAAAFALLAGNGGGTGAVSEDHFLSKWIVNN